LSLSYFSTFRKSGAKFTFFLKVEYMEKLTMSIYLIILIKVIFIILAIAHLYYSFINKENSEEDKKVVFWKERVEFIFIIFMSLLLIYIFNPRANRTALINSEIKLLFYLFGFILLITAKCSIFLKESPIFRNIQNILGKNE